MPTLTIMIGVPGSGKSYAANKISEKTGAAIVSTDHIRKVLFGSEACQKDPSRVFTIAYRLSADYLSHGRNVIFDATNTRGSDRADTVFSIKRLCDELSLDFDNEVEVCAVFVNTPLSVCLERNAKRERIVPEEVILKMYRRLSNLTKESLEAEGFDEVFVLDEDCEPDKAYERE